MNATMEAIRIPCPVHGCESVLLFRPLEGRMSLRQRARSVVRSHLMYRHTIRTRARSLLIDEAVEGL